MLKAQANQLMLFEDFLWSQLKIDEHLLSYVSVPTF